MSISSDEIARIRDLFQDAERQIKKAEEISGDLAVPAVNELRYAGCHLLAQESPHFDCVYGSEGCLG
ncbi:MAG TPA: hypothetical protein PKY87_18545, partial [Terricaulis sp.]|nr:hypothetical protein [Terricaulis sp.]